MTTIPNPKITAKIIADSVGVSNSRITTFVLTFPRFILSEFNTHRALSKNSASSRAIPFKKMADMVLNDPFVPTMWMKDHKGMQGTEYFSDPDAIHQLKVEWMNARFDALERATRLNTMGLSKQLCNRMLEPYLTHTVICTGTDWENFFALRAHEDAEIHIQELAYKMLQAYNQSTPKALEIGEWHIPFGDLFDEQRLKEHMPYIQPASVGWYMEHMDHLKVKIATARCARVSYLNFEGKDDYGADLKLYDRLLASGHMSPFEHCAQYQGNNLPYGNFRGWKQLRQTFPNENRRDERVIRH